MRLINLGLVISLPYAIRAAQIPFETQSVPVLEPLGDLGQDSEWKNFSTGPDANGTSHLIFDTVNSLLQHWPNTRYRNGHNILPGTVPVGTLLYHGRADSNVPTIPEWTTMDPEHSYPFCGGPAGKDSITGCWHLTLVATRPLKVLYLDGSSAANMKETLGPVYNSVHSLKASEWRWTCGEIMLCDFKNGVELLSADFLAAMWARHITPPLWRPEARSDPHSLDPTTPENKTSLISQLLRFESVRGGSWHNAFPGETRISLDLTRLVSFYDTALVPSLVSYRTGKERWDHRLQNISSVDLTAVKTRLRAAFAPDNVDPGSGVDWRTLYRVLVDRYADRLEMLEYLLNTTTTDNIDTRARTIQMQLRVMLTPYILYSARPADDSAVSMAAEDYAWAAPVWRGCATRHTAHIHASPPLQSRLTASERLLLNALDETNREICRVVVRMWATGVHAELDALISPDEDDVPDSTASKEGLSPEVLSRVVEKWQTSASKLISWLDWSVWVNCRPACSFEEMCYLPTWPFFWDQIDDPENECGEWKRPQPRCIRQFEPYSPL
ncbi:hypothetical protein DFH07DRAFT_219668 [Mycena maculata]|uniref:Uncharacterized protein n=1 Tax=Mycena maculata TaxID=230809 RepID=A0AAD7HWM9_9AGAR|nr:hypothetical protein DFH07DRAFT_219668 [Mycena maculata]